MAKHLITFKFWSGKELSLLSFKSGKGLSPKKAIILRQTTS